MNDVFRDRHIAARKTIIDVAGVPQPAPGPRFSRTPADTPTAGPRQVGEHTDEILAAANFDEETRRRLYAEAIVA
jgi:alpha-methylacyl-CoA racemase